MTNWSWLIPHLVFVSVLAGFVWLLCLGLKRRPAWRHALWLVVLIKLVTPNFVSWPWTVNEIAGHFLLETERLAVDTPGSDALIPAIDPEPASTEPLTDPLLSEVVGFPVDVDNSQEPPPIAVVEFPSETPTIELPEIEDSLLTQTQFPVTIEDAAPNEVRIEPEETPSIAASLIASESIELGFRCLQWFWIAGSTVVVIGQLRRLFRQRNVVKQGEPASQNLFDTVEGVSRELQMKPVGVIVVRGIPAPFLWCFGRPLLVWPESLLDAETLQTSRGIVAHELAHVRRRDHWVAWLELAAGVIWWWNPLFWFVRRRLRESAEMSCDAVALSLYDDRKAYAELFLRLSSKLQPGMPTPVLGVSTGCRASFERRIEMIMSDRASGKMSVWGILTVICFAVVALPSLSVGKDVASPGTEVLPVLVESDPAEAPSIDVSDESDPLRAKGRQAIELASRRKLDASQHTPWQIMQGVLALRRDFEIEVDGKLVNALEWIRQGQRFQGEPWIEKTPFGGRFHPFTRPYTFEGHPNQFLALLSMSDLPRDFTFETSEGPVSIDEMVEHAKLTVNDDEEHAWTLWALSKYLPSNAYWHNSRGEVWTIERLVEKQSRADFDKSICGGTLGLFALAHARKQHLDQGRKLYGAWIEADRVIKRHIDLARDLQHPEGMFSCGYFAQRDYKEDFAERLSATGHTLEFLMMAVPDEELEKPWIRKGVEAVAEDLINHRNEHFECGALYHAVSGLVLYLDRTSAATNQRTTSSVLSQESTKPEFPESAATDDFLPANTTVVEETRDAEGKPAALNGIWILTGPKPEVSALELYIQIFDTQNGIVTTFLKDRTQSVTNKLQFAIDTNHTPHQLTTYGDNMIKQSIFEARGETLRIANFKKSNLARPKSFEDSHPAAGKLAVLEFKRISSPLAPERVRAINVQISRGNENSISGSSTVMKRLSSLMKRQQPSKAVETRSSAQADNILDVANPESQTLPEIKVSFDAEIQKMQRRWLEINVESAQVEFEDASQKYEYQDRLSKKGYASSTDLEQAQAAVRQRELQLEKAKIMLDLFELHAKRMRASPGEPFPSPEASSPEAY